jgi:ketosteroid isomerase-like protein
MADGIKDQVSDVVSSAKRRVGLETPSAADDDGRIGIVRGAWRAFGEGDFDGFMDTFKDDVQWQAPTGKAFPGGDLLDGKDEIRSGFIDDVGRTYTSFGFKPDTFLDADEADAVVVLGNFVGDGVEGENLDEAAVQIWKFEGNSVSGVRVFVDTDPFPDVVTEQKLEEWEQEDREKEEKEKEEAEGKSDDDDDEKKDDSDDSDDSDDDDGGSEGKSDDDSKGESDDGEKEDPKASSSSGDSSSDDDSSSESGSSSSSSESDEEGKRESREEEESS